MTGNEANTEENEANSAENVPNTESIKENTKGTIEQDISLRNFSGINLDTLATLLND